MLLAWDGILSIACDCKVPFVSLSHITTVAAINDEIQPAPALLRRADRSSNERTLLGNVLSNQLCVRSSARCTRSDDP